MSEIILTIDGIDPVALYGENNSKLNLLKRAFPDITITSRGENLKLSGERAQTQKAKGKVEKMVRILKETDSLSEQSVIDLLENG